MKTILALAILTTLLAGTALYFSNNTYESDEIQAYEDDIIFKQGTVYWDLSSQSLDNQQVISIGKSIGRKRVQKWVGTDYIYGIEINLSKNNAISDISEILAGISKGLSTHLTSISIDIASCSFNWDPSFMGWELPPNVTEFSFDASNNSSNSNDNLTKVIVNSPKKLTTLKISAFNNSFSSFYKFFEEVSKVQTSVQQFKINLGYNYTSMNSGSFQTNLKDFLSNNNALNEVNIGLAKEAVTTTFLNQIESILYDRVDDKILKKITLDLRENNLSEAKVTEIFADIKQMIGSNLEIFL